MKNCILGTQIAGRGRCKELADKFCKACDCKDVDAFIEDIIKCLAGFD